MIYVALALAALWFLVTLRTLQCLRWCAPLPAPSTIPLESPLPKVSVVIAARDEGARIKRTVGGLLAQEGIELELIVVDDRSRDDTPRILAELAREDSRLSVVRVDELPPRWLGKCHACSRGAERAQGEWLLFADGDVHMGTDLIRRAIAVARREQADHLTLMPGLNCTGVLTRATVLAFGQLMSLHAPAAEINQDRGKRAIGVGAFNLLRREAYCRLGGHEPLRMEVLDDMKLGLLVRRAGLRGRVYSGLDEYEVEWAHSIPQVIRALEKNWFAAVEYQLLPALLIVFVLFGSWFGAFLAPLYEPVWGWLAFAAVLSTMFPAMAQARLSRWPWYSAILAPLGYPIFATAGVHSIWKTLRQGGVRWRETFYPLNELRAGVVRW
jgi:glycosyltransferase involved in cell wall biosynthesis